MRWELYKPAQTEKVELLDHEGRRLGAWTFQGIRVKTQAVAPPPMAAPVNGGPSDSEIAALASKITWTSPGADGTMPAAPRPQPVPAPPPEPPPRLGPIPSSRMNLPQSRAGMTQPLDPRSPRPLPEATPQVQPVVPPRVNTARSQAFQTPLDPRHPGVLPEATPRVSPVVPPRVNTSRSQTFQAPVDPRHPGVLPEATPRVSPVVPPRVGTSRSHAFATPLDPRRPGALPEPTPEVHPVVPPRTTVPPPRGPLSARMEPGAPAPLPEAARPELRVAPGTWPGAGEALNLIRGPRSGKRLVLTFDGGSNAEAANEILDTLRAKGIRTSFFLTGTFIQSFPDITRRIAREGHEIGNHTQNHPHFAPGMRRDPQWTRERFRQEMLSADFALFQLLGRPMDPLWRAPYGENTAEIRAWAEELGYRHVGWSEGADSLDWATPKERKLYRTGDAILARLHSRLQRDGDGLIALMHLGSEREEKDRPSHNLAGFIDRALREGWTFVTVGDYVRTLGKPAWDPARRMAWLNGRGSGGAN